MRQRTLERGATGVSIDHASNVQVGPGAHALVFAGVGLVLTLGLGFATNAAGLQDAGCRVPGLVELCRRQGLGHVPSHEELSVWQTLRSTSDCGGLRGYLSEWPAGVFAQEAQARLSARVVVEEASWVPQEHRLPLVVERGAAFPTEQEAQADALLRSEGPARELCSFSEQSGLFRLVDVELQPPSWRCIPLADAWRCGLSAQLLCRVSTAETTLIERCPSPEAPAPA